MSPLASAASTTTTTTTTTTQTSHSPNSDHSFPFEQDDHASHQTLLPNGILNDDEDEVVPWPNKRDRMRDRTEGDKVAYLRVRSMPQGMQHRELAAYFTFADGYIDATISQEESEVSRV